MNQIARSSIAVGRKAIWLPYAVAALIYAFFAWKNYGFNFDDSLIYLRYIHNLLQGQGLVFNPGDKFNGLTSPAFTLPLALLSLLTRDPQLSAWLICTVSGFFAPIVWFDLFRTAIRQKVNVPGWLADATSYVGLLLALILPFFFLTFGMETTLYALISGLLLRQYIRECFASAAFLAGVLVATRVEGGALLLGIAVHQLICRKEIPPNPLRLIALFLVVPIAVFGFNWIYYGAPFAETGMAKIWQGESGLWGRHAFAHLHILRSLAFQNSKLAFNGSLILAFLGYFGLRGCALSFILGIYLVVYWVVFVTLNIPGYHWYYGPYFSVLPFFAVFGAVWLVLLFRKWTGLVGASAMSLLALTPLAVLARNSVAYDMHPLPARADYAEVGNWLRQHTPKDAKIAAVEVGTIGYYSDRTIIDILGLVSRHNAQLLGERQFDGWLRYYRPDYFFVHTPIWPHEYSLYAVAARYGISEVCDFKVPPFRLFRITGQPGTATTCDGQRWVPVQAGSVATQAIESGVRLVDVELQGNIARADLLLTKTDDIARALVPVVGAYGMIERVATAPTVAAHALASDHRVTLFFASPSAASEWMRNPRILFVDSKGQWHRIESVNDLPGQER